LIFILPGLGWIGVLKERVQDRLMLLFFIVFFSLVALWFGLGLLHLLGLAPSLNNLLFYLLVITNLGIFLTHDRQTLAYLIGEPRAFFRRMFYSFFIFGILFMGVIRFPVLEDYDDEIPGTAYGLIYEFKPYLAYNLPEKYFYFAHPPLVNMYSAAGLLLLDRLETMKFYYDSAKAAEKILASQPGEIHQFYLPSPNEDGTQKVEVKNINNRQFRVVITGPTETSFQEKVNRDDLTLLFSDRDRLHFYELGLELNVRIGTMFIAVLLFLSTLEMILKYTHREWLGVLGGALLVFAPGVYARAITVNHEVIALYAGLVLVYSFLLQDRWDRSNLPRMLLWMLPGVFAAFANQKIVLVLGAIWIYQVIRWLQKDQSRLIDGLRMLFFPGAIGFVLGELLFIGYGFFIERTTFVRYYLLGHFVDRVLHLRTIYSGYPNMVRLWFETGIEAPVIVIAALGGALLLRKWIQDGLYLLVALWGLVGAIAFSLVDWRMSKHMMQLVPAASVFAILLYEKADQSQRHWLLAGYVLALFFSIVLSTALLINFYDYLSTPVW